VLTVTTTRRGAATRSLIVAATAGLMARAGVAATSLDEVRAATGTSKSQLYHHFGDKAGLVRAVIRHQGEAVVAAQHLEGDAPRDAPSLLRWRYRVVSAQRARGFAAGCPLGSLAAELAGAPAVDGETRRELTAAFDRWRELLEAGLRAGIAEGALPAAADPGAHAEALVAAVQGGSLLAAVADGPGPLQAALDRAVEPLLRAPQGV
jgi:TetR/AcrR family transcriptional repressor of nem operon